MTDKPDFDTVTASLFAKLKECDLTAEEQALLDIILDLAKDVLGPDSTFATQIKESFAEESSTQSTTTHSITKMGEQASASITRTSSITRM